MVAYQTDVPAYLDSLDFNPYIGILADPPWPHRSNSIVKPGRNPRRHYKCLTIAQLCSLGSKIQEVAHPDCALFLWVPGSMLAKGWHLAVLDAWGFIPSGIAFTWIKLRPDADPTHLFIPRDLSKGLGHTTRKSCEFCILGKRKKGHSPRRDCSVLEAVFEHRREHSRKPDEVHRRIERYLGDQGPLLELFARASREGWTTWGDETTKFDPPKKGNRR